MIQINLVEIGPVVSEEKTLLVSLAKKKLSIFFMLA
jgi:hypothetical protein